MGRLRAPVAAGLATLAVACVLLPWWRAGGTPVLLVDGPPAPLAADAWTGVELLGAPPSIGLAVLAAVGLGRPRLAWARAAWPGWWAGRRPRARAGCSPRGVRARRRALWAAVVLGVTARRARRRAAAGRGRCPWWPRRWSGAWPPGSCPRPAPRWPTGPSCASPTSPTVGRCAVAPPRCPRSDLRLTLDRRVGGRRHRRRHRDRSATATSTWWPGCPPTTGSGTRAGSSAWRATGSRASSPPARCWSPGCAPATRRRSASRASPRRAPSGSDGTVWLRGYGEPAGAVRRLDLHAYHGAVTLDVTVLPVVTVDAPVGAAPLAAADLLPVPDGALRRTASRLERVTAAPGRTVVTPLAGGLDPACGLTAVARSARWARPARSRPPRTAAPGWRRTGGSCGSHRTACCGRSARRCPGPPSRWSRRRTAASSSRRGWALWALRPRTRPSRGPAAHPLGLRARPARRRAARHAGADHEHGHRPAGRAARRGRALGEQHPRRSDQHRLGGRPHPRAAGHAPGRRAGPVWPDGAGGVWWLEGTTPVHARTGRGRRRGCRRCRCPPRRLQLGPRPRRPATARRHPDGRLPARRHPAWSTGPSPAASCAPTGGAGCSRAAGCSRSPTAGCWAR